MRSSFFLLPFIVLAACTSGSEQGKTKSGFSYTIIGKRAAGAQHANIGDYMTLHATYRNGKDSVFGSTHQQKFPIRFKIDSVMQGRPDPFAQCYVVLAAGDTANFEIPTDTLFKGAPPNARPRFLPQGTVLKFGCRVSRVETDAQLKARIGKELPAMASANGGKFETLPTGEMLAITQAGNGAMAQPGDTLTVHYTGTFADTTYGKKPFDSSRTLGKPFKFVLGAGQVIPAWDVAMGRIPEGGKGVLLVPYARAYGEYGMPGMPGMANLVFDVEIVSVIKGKGAPALPPSMMPKPQM